MSVSILYARVSPSHVNEASLRDQLEKGMAFCLVSHPGETVCAFTEINSGRSSKGRQALEDICNLLRENGGGRVIVAGHHVFSPYDAVNDVICRNIRALDGKLEIAEPTLIPDECLDTVNDLSHFILLNGECRFETKSDGSGFDWEDADAFDKQLEPNISFERAFGEEGNSARSANDSDKKAADAEKRIETFSVCQLSITLSVRDSSLEDIEEMLHRLECSSALGLRAKALVHAAHAAFYEQYV